MLCTLHVICSVVLPCVLVANAEPTEKDKKALADFKLLVGETLRASAYKWAR